MFDEYYDDEDEGDIGEFKIPGKERGRSKLPYVNPDDEDKIRCSTTKGQFCLNIFFKFSTIQYLHTGTDSSSGANGFSEGAGDIKWAASKDTGSSIYIGLGKCHIKF